MERSHYFHLDAGDHSVTVNLYGGHPGLVELLIDGKETSHAPLQRNRPQLVTGELPTDPPLSVIRHITPGHGVPRCAAVIDGAKTLMPRRAF